MRREDKIEREYGEAGFGLSKLEVLAMNLS